jgi:hypothetical protein
MKRFYFFAILSGLLLTNMFDAGAAVRYVKTTAAGTGDGSSWANASGDLQKTVNASVSGDEIWVAAGVYKPRYSADGYNAVTDAYPDTTGGRKNAFVLKDGVKIYGGFPADANDTGHTSLADRDWNTNKTVLSGDVENNDTCDANGISTAINGDNVSHVVIGVGLSANTVLDGFTITGGNANGSSYIPCNGQNPATARSRFTETAAAACPISIYPRR